MLSTASRRGRPALLLPALIALGLTAATIACTASGHVEGKSQLPTPAGPITIEGRIGINDPDTYKATNPTPKCFKVTFRDADGNVTGTTTISAGGTSTGTIPPGSTEYSATESPCPDSSAAGSGGSMRRINWRHARPFLVTGGPLLFDPGSAIGSASYSFSVRAHSQAEAETIARGVLLSPIGTAIDSRVSILTYDRIEAGRTSATLYSISREEFASWTLELNGEADYARLGYEAIQIQGGPELFVVSTSIPLADLNGYDVWNEAILRHRSGSAPELEAELSLLYSSAP